MAWTTSGIADIACGTETSVDFQAEDDGELL